VHSRLLNRKNVASLSTKTSTTKLDFSDTKQAYAVKSFSALMRSFVVFNMCRVTPLVRNADRLVKMSYAVAGERITNFVLKHTFFGHFCAGEDEVSIKPTIDALQKHGVGAILDYAAEADLADNDKTEADREERIEVTTENSRKAIVRIYPYEGEELCDMHMKTFEKCIRTAAALNTVGGPPGLAAIKVTALGNPELLKRCSHTLDQMERFFRRLDPTNSGYVAVEAFLAEFDKKQDGKNVLEYFSAVFDTENLIKVGKIDYIGWTEAVPLQSLHLVTDFCTGDGPLRQSVLTEEERELFVNMKNRLNYLADLAQKLGVRLMIDAEQVYFQRAIDNLSISRAKKYNNRPGSPPVIFNTYQLYRKDAVERMKLDMARAKKSNYTFAAKIVRGAYLVMERKYAASNGLPDPIHDTKEDTHAAYNEAMVYALERMADCHKSNASVPKGEPGHGVEIMVASHNQDSVELAIEKMADLGLPNNSPVYFGQLLGMSDHLTFTLGSNGYQAYKYVPYGKVGEVMPYLLRRAQENSDVLGSSKNEISMLSHEVKRRVMSRN